MRFVTLTLVVDSYSDTLIKVDPSRVFAVGALFEAGDVVPGLCEVFLPTGTIVARGTVEEVSAALESATSPPVAAAVEVAPTDLERAAKVLDVIAACSGESTYDEAAIDRAIGADGITWTDTMEKARALAAKLRGGG